MIQRYELVWTGSSSLYMQIQEMEPDDDGEWVRWEDVQKLLDAADLL